MLYYLFDFLEKQFQFPGASVFQYLSFRAAAAVLMSLIFSMLFGKRIILLLKKQQIGESVRDLGLEGQKEKEGTPTMGGIIIILGTLIPVLLLAQLNNIYILLLITTTLWMGMIGGVDDYIKVFKKNKEGLKGKFKLFGQLLLGVFIGATIYFHPDVTVRVNPVVKQAVETSPADNNVKEVLTTIPLLKNNEL